MIDDAVVETVAGDADAGMRQRLGGEAAVAAFEAHDREVGRAAAEIGDKHGRVVVEGAGIEEGGADRLVDIARPAEAEATEGVAVALHGEPLVGVRSGKADRAADLHSRRAELEVAVGMALDSLDEGDEQVFELRLLTKDPRFLEAAAGGEGLEGLDEAVCSAARHQLVHRPGTALEAGGQPAAGTFLPVAERRDIALQRGAVVLKGDGLGPSVGAGNGDDGVGGAEIDADRHGLGGGGHGRLAEGASGKPAGIDHRRSHGQSGRSSLRKCFLWVSSPAGQRGGAPDARRARAVDEGS